MNYTCLSIPVGTRDPAVSKAALDQPGIRYILRLLREKRSFSQVYCDCFVCLSGEIYLCQPTSKLHEVFALNVQVLLFRAALGGLVPGWGK